jgi:DNA repair photolyase
MKKQAPTLPPDNKEQSEAFIKKAKEIDADESGKGFNRFFEGISPLPDESTKTPLIKKKTSGET